MPSQEQPCSKYLNHTHVLPVPKLDGFGNGIISLLAPLQENFS